MKKSHWTFLASLALAGLASAQPVPPQGRIVERELGSDRFVSGCPLRIAQPTAGDLLAAGCDVEVTAAVAGDAVLAGGTLRIDAGVGGGLYAVGGKITVNGTVGRNVRAAGGHVEIGSNAKVAGNLTVAGGDVAMRGAVKGYVQAAGGRVLIDGAVDGDVVAAGGEVELGPNARIGGRLLYGSDQLKRDPAAQVAGGVQVLERHHGAGMEHVRWHRHAGGGWIWSAGVILIATLIAAAMPGACARVAEELRSHPWFTLLWGFIALVCIPVAALLMLITIIGIPLALLAVLLYLALLLVGYCATAASIADLALRRYKPEMASRTAWRIGAAIAAALTLTLLARIPFVGGLVGLAALLLGVGAIATAVFHRSRAAPQP